MTFSNNFPHRQGTGEINVSLGFLFLMMSSSRFIYRFIPKSTLISDPPIVICMRSHHLGVPCRMALCFSTNSFTIAMSSSLFVPRACFFGGRVPSSGDGLLHRFHLLGTIKVFSISDKVL